MGSRGSQTRSMDSTCSASAVVASPYQSAVLAAALALWPGWLIPPLDCVVRLAALSAGRSKGSEAGTSWSGDSGSL